MPTIKKQMRDFSRDVARADRVLSNYKDVDLADIEREFEGKTRDSKGSEFGKETSSENKRKYALAYMLKKYGENARKYAEMSSDYAEVYGLDERENPYIHLLDVMDSSEGVPKYFNGDRASRVLFDLVDDDSEAVSGDREKVESFFTLLKGLSSNSNQDDDFLAYYIQAVSWILDPQKMRKFNPENPGLEDSKLDDEQREAKIAILSGEVTEKEDLSDKINKLGPQPAYSDGDVDARTKRKEEDDARDSMSRFRSKFMRFSDDEQKEFKRMAGILGIDLAKLGIGDA